MQTPQRGHAKSKPVIKRAASPHVGTAIASQSTRLRAVATTKPAPKAAVSQVGNDSGSRKTPTATAPKPAPKARQRRTTTLAAKPNISESAMPPVPRRHRHEVCPSGLWAQPSHTFAYCAWAPSARAWNCPFPSRFYEISELGVSLPSSAWPARTLGWAHAGTWVTCQD